MIIIWLLILEIVSIVMGVTLIKQNRTGSSKYLPFIMILLFLLSIIEVYKVTINIESQLVVLKSISYSLKIFLVLVYFMEVLKFTNSDKTLSGKSKLVIEIMPLIFVLLIVTNEFHHLFIKEVNHIYINDYMILNYNILYYVFEIYCGGLIIYTIYIIIKNFKKVKEKHPIFYFILLTTSIFMLVADVLSYLQWVRNSYIVSYYLIMLNLFCMYLFRVMPKNIIPFARELVIDNMNELLIVLDKNKVIVDINKSFKERFDKDGIGIGMNIYKFVSIIPNVTEEVIDFVLNNKFITLYDDEGETSYNVKISKIKDDEDKEIGNFVLLRDVSEIKIAMDSLEYWSNHDKLTGLYNRNYFQQALNSQDQPDNLPISVIVGDLDGLKMINDTFGHSKGDEFLRAIANKLKKNFIGNQTTVSRIGGDEFCIIMPKTFGEEAQVLINKTNMELKGTDEEVTYSISLGVATKEREEESIDEIYNQADQNMYKKKLIQSKSYHSLMLTSLKNTLKANTTETEEHCHRMEKMAKELGAELGLKDIELEELAILASIHDIGKVGVPNYILNKKEKLNVDEWNKIKQHPVIGYNIASTSKELANIALGILTHHERWDGKGYPQGIKGDRIPFMSRIIAIVDSYDVMTNGRPYKKSMTNIESLEEIERCAGFQFDPMLARKFINMMKNI